MVADWALLRQYAATRDGDALARIIRRHRGLVYGTCMRILRNEADAEDAAQECFIKFARHAHRVRVSVPGWLHRCATHVSLNARKQAQARLRRERIYGEAREAERPRETAWDRISPHVDTALAELPPEYVHVLVASFMLQRPGGEIARELNISRAGFYRRRDAGLRLLRRKLQRTGVLVSASALAVLLTSNAGAAAAVATATDKLAELVAALPGRNGPARRRPRAPTRRLASARPSPVGTLVGAGAGLVLTTVLLVSVYHEVTSRGTLAGLFAGPSDAAPAGSTWLASARVAPGTSLASEVADIVEPPETAASDAPTGGAEDEWDGFWTTPEPAASAAARPGPTESKPADPPAAVDLRDPQWPFAPLDLIDARLRAIDAARKASKQQVTARRKRWPGRTPSGGIHLSVHRGAVSNGRVLWRSGTRLSAPRARIVRGSRR